MRKAAGQFITQRAMKDPTFGDKVRMARERMWVTEIHKLRKTLGVGTEITYEYILDTAQNFDINPERTAGLLGIEIPSPPPETSERQ